MVANTLGEIKAENFLRDSGLCGDEGTYQHDAPKLEAKAVVYMLAERLLEVVAKTIKDTLT